MLGRMGALRTVTVGVCLLVVVGCSSSHGSSNASSTPTTSPATSTTANPMNTPNPIPYVVGEKIGLPNGWLVTVTDVHLHYSPPGLSPARSGQQYVAIDLRMENQGPGTYTVNANSLFTLVDTAHQQRYVAPVPGHSNNSNRKE